MFFRHLWLECPWLLHVEAPPCTACYIDIAICPVIGRCSGLSILFVFQASSFVCSFPLLSNTLKAYSISILLHSPAVVLGESNKCRHCLARQSKGLARQSIHLFQRAKNRMPMVRDCGYCACFMHGSKPKRYLVAASMEALCIPLLIMLRSRVKEDLLPSGLLFA